MPGHLFVCGMGLRQLRYLQGKVRDLGFSMKDLVKTLERIRLEVAVRAGTPRTSWSSSGRGKRSGSIGSNSFSSFLELARRTWNSKHLDCNYRLLQEECPPRVKLSTPFAYMAEMHTKVNRGRLCPRPVSDIVRS